MGCGDRTVDEMGHAWLNITCFSDDEFKAGAKRAATTGASAAAATAVSGAARRKSRGYDEAPFPGNSALLFWQCLQGAYG